MTMVACYYSDSFAFEAGNPSLSAGAAALAADEFIAPIIGLQCIVEPLGESDFFRGQVDREDVKEVT